MPSAALGWQFTERGSAGSESDGKIVRSCSFSVHKHATTSMPISATKICTWAMPGTSSASYESLLELLQQEASNSRRLRIVQAVVIGSKRRELLVLKGLQRSQSLVATQRSSLNTPYVIS